MDNNQQPKFDPATGRPLGPQPAEQPAPKFDPETGRPLNPQPEQPGQAEQPKPRFDPETGRPLEQPHVPPQPEPQPQRLDTQPGPGYVPPQQGQPYTQPPYTQPQPEPAKEKTDGLSIGALVCGILSLICCCCGWLSIALGVGAVIFAVMSKKGSPKMSGMALGGMICGIIGGGIALISVIAGLFMNSTGLVEDLINEFSPNHGYNDIVPEYDIYDFFG